MSTSSFTGAPVEDIARLAGHASSRTEIVYRRELRPVLTTAAEVMERDLQATIIQVSEPRALITAECAVTDPPQELPLMPDR